MNILHLFSKRSVLPEIRVGQIWNLKRHKDQQIKVVIVEDGFVTYKFANGYCSSQARSVEDFLKLYELNSWI